MLILKEITRKGVAFLSHVQEVLQTIMHNQRKHEKMHVAAKWLELFSVYLYLQILFP